MLSLPLHKSLISIARNVKQRKQATLANFLAPNQPKVLTPNAQMRNQNPNLTQKPKAQSDLNMENREKWKWSVKMWGGIRVSFFWMVKDTYLRKIPTHMPLDSFLFPFFEGQSNARLFVGKPFCFCSSRGWQKKKQKVWHNVAKCVAKQ